MDRLFERHDAYLSDVPMTYFRNFMEHIDWTARLIMIKGPKGVGKSTLMQQYIKKNFGADDRHVLYCSADANYFSTHTLTEVADNFAKVGGKYLFIDEVHKYAGWSREVKDIYDLHKGMHLVLSGSSLVQLNDGQADLSRRIVVYDMPGLSMREFLMLDAGLDISPVSLSDLLASPNKYCSYVRSICHPLEHFGDYLKAGYYPFYFENKRIYQSRIESVINYIIDSELTKFRSLEVGNCRNIKALLQILSQIVPYEVDISKLSRTIGIQRPTTLKYLKHLEEAALIRRLFTHLDTISDLQKPDKILLDNSNLLYTLSDTPPEIGTVRETFFCNQLHSAEHRVEYGGIKTGDFRIDRDLIVEVGGPDKSFKQVQGETNAFLAVDDIDNATARRIPLWAFGFLY